MQQTQPVTVARSLQAFMAHLIDYAGLFPPAKLPLPDAFAQYSSLRHDPDRWMLSRFIIPAAQLANLSAIAGQQFHADDPFVFAILGRSGSTADEFMAGMEADLAEMRAFKQRHGNGVVLDVFEVRLPASVTATNDQRAIGDLITASAEHLVGDSGTLWPFYEVAFNANWDRGVSATVQAIAAHNAATRLHPAGYKLRCGGTEASAFPTPAQIAHAIATCHAHGVALKATAGLHHPVRHYAESVQTKMHGFFNVFAAGILAHVYNLTAEQLTAIIADEDTSGFIFAEDTFTWHDLSVTTAQIAVARQHAVISYGSCSFDEPRDDLAGLGLLSRRG